MAKLYYIYIGVFFMLVYLTNLKGFGQGLNDGKSDQIMRIKERIFTGGTFGIGFSNSIFINISPLLGYKINERLQLGVGATYLYYKVKTPLRPFVSKTYGGRFFGKYFFYDSMFGYSEVELLNGNWIINEPNHTIISLFVGGGFSQPISSNTNIVLLGLYNLTESTFSPYTSNPMIRVGLTVGF